MRVNDQWKKADGRRRRHTLEIDNYHQETEFAPPPAKHGRIEKPRHHASVGDYQHTSRPKDVRKNVDATPLLRQPVVSRLGPAPLRDKRPKPLFAKQEPGELTMAERLGPATIQSRLGPREPSPLLLPSSSSGPQLPDLRTELDRGRLTPGPSPLPSPVCVKGEYLSSESLTDSKKPISATEGGPRTTSKSVSSKPVTPVVEDKAKPSGQSATSLSTKDSVTDLRSLDEFKGQQIIKRQPPIKLVLKRSVAKSSGAESAKSSNIESADVPQKKSKGKVVKLAQGSTTPSPSATSPASGVTTPTSLTTPTTTAVGAVAMVPLTKPAQPSVAPVPSSREQQDSLSGRQEKSQRPAEQRKQPPVDSRQEKGAPVVTGSKEQQQGAELIQLQGVKPADLGVQQKGSDPRRPAEKQSMEPRQQSQSSGPRQQQHGMDPRQQPQGRQQQHGMDPRQQPQGRQQQHGMEPRQGPGVQQPADPKKQQQGPNSRLGHESANLGQGQGILYNRQQGVGQQQGPRQPRQGLEGVGIGLVQQAPGQYPAQHPESLGYVQPALGQQQGVVGPQQGVVQPGWIPPYGPMQQPLPGLNPPVRPGLPFTPVLPATVGGGAVLTVVPSTEAMAHGGRTAGGNDSDDEDSDCGLVIDEEAVQEEEEDETETEEDEVSSDVPEQMRKDALPPRSFLAVMGMPRAVKTRITTAKCVLPTPFVMQQESLLHRLHEAIKVLMMFLNGRESWRVGLMKRIRVVFGSYAISTAKPPAKLKVLFRKELAHLRRQCDLDVGKWEERIRRFCSLCSTLPKKKGAIWWGGLEASGLEEPVDEEQSMDVGYSEPNDQSVGEDQPPMVGIQPPSVSDQPPSSVTPQPPSVPPEPPSITDRPPEPPCVPQEAGGVGTPGGMNTEGERSDTDDVVFVKTQTGKEVVVISSDEEDLEEGELLSDEEPHVAVKTEPSEVVGPKMCLEAPPMGQWEPVEKQVGYVGPGEDPEASCGEGSMSVCSTASDEGLFQVLDECAAQVQRSASVGSHSEAVSGESGVVGSAGHKADQQRSDMNLSDAKKELGSSSRKAIETRKDTLRSSKKSSSVGADQDMPNSTVSGELAASKPQSSRDATKQPSHSSPKKGEPCPSKDDKLAPSRTSKDDKLPSRARHSSGPDDEDPRRHTDADRQRRHERHLRKPVPLAYRNPNRLARRSRSRSRERYRSSRRSRSPISRSRRRSTKSPPVERRRRYHSTSPRPKGGHGRSRESRREDGEEEEEVDLELLQLKKEAILSMIQKPEIESAAGNKRRSQSPVGKISTDNSTPESKSSSTSPPDAPVQILASKSDPIVSASNTSVPAVKQSLSITSVPKQPSKSGSKAPAKQSDAIKTVLDKKLKLLKTQARTVSPVSLMSPRSSVSSSRVSSRVGSPVGSPRCQDTSAEDQQSNGKAGAKSAYIKVKI